MDWIRRLHFNAVQFYDWMYRHDMLLPPQERYLDPMGRETDLAAIRAKIAACKAAGIRPIAYGAVYAAAKELFAEHPEWAMYTMDGQAMTFAGWLYYMNIAPSCGWSEHILAEFRKAVAFGFSGIHMDTYGFPKQVWDAERRPVELTDALPKLIDRAAEAVRKEDSAAGVIFNAVNNWPMEAVAGTKQDAVYIEVWPPNDRYYDLYTLIREARLCSGKQVVLAAYLHPFQQADTDGAERRSACPGPRSALPAAHSWCWAKIKPPCRTATMQTTLLSEQSFCPSCSGTAIFWCAMPRFCIWMPAWTSDALRPAGSMRMFNLKQRTAFFPRTRRLVPSGA